MENNQWPIYEHIKRNWRKTGNISTLQQVKAVFPDKTDWAITEGMIEFQIAYERSYKHERHIPEDVVQAYIADFYRDLA